MWKERLTIGDLLPPQMGGLWRAWNFPSGNSKAFHLLFQWLIKRCLSLIALTGTINRRRVGWGRGVDLGVAGIIKKKKA
mgnify:CR=1 FL=1